MSVLSDDEWAKFAPDPLDDLARQTEEATDDFVLAIDAKTEAEGTYLRAFHRAYAENMNAKSEASRTKAAEAQSLSQRIDLKAAEDAVERAKAVLRTRLAILSAAQTHYRAVERQT